MAIEKMCEQLGMPKVKARPRGEEMPRHTKGCGKTADQQGGKGAKSAAWLNEDPG